MGNLISFFKKVADGLRAEGNFGTAHVYRSTLNIVTTFHESKYLDFHQVNPEWLKDFESLSSQSWFQLEYCFHLSSCVACGL